MTPLPARSITPLPALSPTELSEVIMLDSDARPQPDPAVASTNALHIYDTLRAKLMANPPIDVVVCKTNAALLAYRAHTRDYVQALPAGWVTTAAGRNIVNNSAFGRVMEKVVARTRLRLAQGDTQGGVCIGPLNNRKCRSRRTRHPRARSRPRDRTPCPRPSTPRHSAPRPFHYPSTPHPSRLTPRPSPSPSSGTNMALAATQAGARSTCGTPRACRRALM